MTEKKYTGWVRLGIVFSVLWLLGASMTIGLLYNKRINDFNSITWETRNQGRFIIVGEESFLFECNAKAISHSIDNLTEFQDLAKPECHIKIDRVTLVTIVPVVVGWLVIPLVVWVVLWVRKGFKK